EAQTIFTPVNPGAVGTGDVTPDTPTVSGVAGALFTAGADGLKSVALSTPPAFDVIYKASNGLALTESVTWGAGSVNATTGATTFTATSAHYAGGAATLVVNVDGSYTFTLNAPIVNDAGSATGNEENTSLAFGLTVTDGDGDTAAATLTVQVNDDTPVGHTVAPTTILDDEAQTIFTPVNPGAVGTGDVTPDTPTVSGVAGALFTAGADGLKSVALSTPPAVDVIYKASNGLALTESVTWGAGSVNATTGATTFTATSAHYAGGAATLVVNVDGSYTFTLNAPIVNAAGSATGNEENTSLAFGLTVTDSDGDTA